MKSCSLILLGGLILLNCSINQNGINIVTSKLPPMDGTNSYYISNRAPLSPSPFVKLPIGSIIPKGWLHNQLQLMANGMVGHLHELSKYLGDDSGWLTFKPDARGWEEPPYWLKGYGDLGYILKDEKIIKETKRWLEAALASQQPDGYFGPPINKKNHDLWPNMVMLFVFQSYYEATGDERILTFRAKYFQYQMNMPREHLLPGSWQKIRGGDNLESIYWLYNRTGDESLLEVAKVIFERTSNWTEGIPTPHGVNITMGVRQPGVYYQQSKDNKHLDAVERNYRTVMQEYGQVPGGMFGADENYIEGATGAT